MTFHGQAETLPEAALIILGLTTSGDFHSVLSHLALLGAEEVLPGAVGPVGQTPEPDACDQDTDNSFLS